jgi:hypothetical protein
MLKTTLTLFIVLFIISGLFVNVSADSYDGMTITMNAIAGLPYLTTNASSVVEETTATLHGYLINQGAGVCTYRFEYDTESGVPYSTVTIWAGPIGTDEAFNANLNSLTPGDLYYYRAQCKNSNGTNSGLELSFLTKPYEPTWFHAVSNVSVVAVELTWAKGTGANRTVIMRATDAYPTGLTDPLAIEVYNGTGTNYTDSLVSIGTHYGYRAWSYVEENGLFKYSDLYAQDDVVVAAPVIFDLRSIAILDNIVPSLIIGIVVENQGVVQADIILNWTLTRVDTGAVLGIGTDTFAVTGHASLLHIITPSTSYVGNVKITFTGGGDVAIAIFDTELEGGDGGGGGGGGGVQPPPVIPVTPPPSEPVFPPIEFGTGATILVLITILFLLLVLFILASKRKKERKKRKHKEHHPGEIQVRYAHRKNQNRQKNVLSEYDSHN